MLPFRSPILSFKPNLQETFHSDVSIQQEPPSYVDVAVLPQIRERRLVSRGEHHYLPYDPVTKKVYLSPTSTPDVIMT